MMWMVRAPAHSAKSTANKRTWRRRCYGSSSAVQYQRAVWRGTNGKPEEKQKHQALTLLGVIVKHAQVKVLAVPHLVVQDDLALEVKDRDMSPIERHSGLILPRSPSVEDSRHGGGGEVLFLSRTRAEEVHSVHAAAGGPLL